MTQITPYRSLLKKKKPHSHSTKTKSCGCKHKAGKKKTGAKKHSHREVPVPKHHYKPLHTPHHAKPKKKKKKHHKTPTAKKEMAHIADKLNLMTITDMKRANKTELFKVMDERARNKDKQAEMISHLKVLQNEAKRLDALKKQMKTQLKM